MFIKLLATKIVASNFLGRSKRLAIIWMRLEFASNPFSISLLESENKATSAPEIRAEQANSKNNNTKPRTDEASTAIIKLIKRVGPGSN